MDTHHARSPAVRARHHMKRVSNSAFKERAAIIGIPAVSTPNTGSEEAGANPPTDSDHNGVLGNGNGGTPVIATAPTATYPSVVESVEPTVNRSREPIVTSPKVSTNPSVIAPVTTAPVVSPVSNTPSLTLSSTTPTSSVVPITSNVDTVPYVTDTVTVPLSSSSAVPVNQTPGNKTANSTGATSKTSIPGAAIGITVAVLGLGILAIAVFFVRKHFLRKREKKRQTWGAGAFPRQSEIMVEKPSERLPFNNAPPTMGGGASAFGAYGAAMNGRSSPYDLPPPPPMSYNNVAPPPPSLIPGNEASQAVAMGRSAAPGPSDALVKCTFIPTLPDELSITTGETVRIVAEYDDGWSLCAKAGGEQGMVPIECLDLRARRSGQDQSDWRNSRRVSSLPPARY